MLLLAAVWQGQVDVQVGLVAGPVDVTSRWLWHLLHWEQADALAALG